MGNVLDDVTDDNIDAHHILRRVDDWEARVKRLYATVSEGCPRAGPPRAGTPVRTHEELMRRFNVDARQIPTLLLANGSGKSAVLEPRGLWPLHSLDQPCVRRYRLVKQISEALRHGESHLIYSMN